MVSLREYIEAVKRNNAEKFAYVNLSLLLLFSCKPYFRWFMPSGMYQLLFLLTTSYSLYRLSAFDYEQYDPIYKRNLMFLICVFAIIFNLPIIHDFHPAYFLDNIIFAEIIFLPVCVYQEAFNLLKKIFYWICLFSIVVWIVHLIGFDLPHYKLLHPDFRVNPIENYRIYGFSVSMYRGAGFENGMERICGLFAEPGHFGIYLGFIMAANKFRFYTKQDIVMLIAGVLTFSTAFYGILTIGLIYRIINHNESWSDLRKIAILCCIAIPCFFANEKFRNTAINRVIGERNDVTVVDLVENRVTKSTQKGYQQFIRSSALWIGMGTTDAKIVQETNWRGGLYRYGIIGITFLSVLLLYMVSIVSPKYKLLIIALSILVMSHRIYMMVHGGLLILVFFAVIISSIEQENEEYTNDEDSETLSFVKKHGI